MSLALMLATAMAMADTCAKDATQAALNDCAAAAYQRADAALNRQWTGTYAAMKQRDAAGGDFGYAAALLASQRAWIAFRDTQCQMEGGRHAGGSAQGMTVAFCKANLTTVRSAQLKELTWQD